MKSILSTILLVISCSSMVMSQKMTLAEYQLVKEFRIDDLDADTYVKINSDYILDRYQMKPPYFIAGESTSKNRVDLYKFIKRQDLTELGLLMIFTNSTSGETTQICLPFDAEKEVWAQYYDDLKYGGQDDPAMLFAISSVLSKELSNIFITGEAGGDYEVESSAYDICFPAGSSVLMADGAGKSIESIQIGDEILAVNSDGGRISTKVLDIEIHNKLYPLAKIICNPTNVLTASTANTSLPMVKLSATPNHPILSKTGFKRVLDLSPGDEISGFFNGQIQSYTVNYVSVSGSTRQVYNLVNLEGNYLVNNIVVSDKKGK